MTSNLVKDNREFYQEHESQERLLSESNLDWTTDRPVMLNNKDQVKPAKVSFSVEKKLKAQKNRKSVAEFMLNILNDQKYHQTTPSVSDD